MKKKNICVKVSNGFVVFRNCESALTSFCISASSRDSSRRIRSKWFVSYEEIRNKREQRGKAMRLEVTEI
jgi:hypothetical protein